jgi:hypothetical protein
MTLRFSVVRDTLSGVAGAPVPMSSFYAAPGRLGEGVPGVPASGSIAMSSLRGRAPNAVRTLSSAARGSITAAFSMRRVVPSYTGSLVRVRNGSTNAEEDFNGDSHGALATAGGTAVSAWLAGAQGFVTRWYDQSGLTRNAVMTTAAQQPLLVEVATDQYAVRFNGTSAAPRFLTLASSASCLSFWTQLQVDQPSGSSIAGTVFSSSASGEGRGFRLIGPDLWVYNQTVGDATWSFDHLGGSTTGSTWSIDGVYGAHAVGPQLLTAGAWHTVSGVRPSGRGVASIDQVGRGSTGAGAEFRDLQGSIAELVLFSRELAVSDGSLLHASRMLVADRTHAPRVHLRAADLLSTIGHDGAVSTWPGAANGANATGVLVGSGARPVLRLDEAAPYVRMGTGGNTNANGGYLELGPMTFESSRTAGFTAVFAVRMRSVATWERVFDFSLGGPSNSNVLLARDGNSSNWTFQVYQGNQPSLATTPSGAIPNNAWTVVAVRSTTSQLSVFERGGRTTHVNVDASVNLNQNDRTFATCWIGRSAWTADGLANMDLREVLVYDRPLSDREVLQAMQRLDTPPAPLAPRPLTPRVHLRASSLLGVVADGAEVPSWVDAVSGRAASGVAVGSATRPTFRLDEAAPYVRIGNGAASSANGNYFDLGVLPVDLSRTGGFTAVCAVRFYGTAFNYERVFDFSEGGSDNDNIVFCRNEATNQMLQATYLHGSTHRSHFGGRIVLNTWTVAAMRVSASQVTLFQRGGVLTSISNTNPLSSKVFTAAFLGRSNWAGEPYPSFDLRDFIVFDRALTDAEVHAAMRSLETDDMPVFLVDPAAATASSERAGSAWGAANAADGLPQASAAGEWQSADACYDASTLVARYSRAFEDGFEDADYTGEWVQLRTPAPVRATSYHVAGDAQEFRLYGGDGHGTWTVLDERASQTLDFARVRTFPVAQTSAAAATSAFDRFALKVRRSHQSAAGGRCSLSLLRVSGRTVTSPPLVEGRVVRRRFTGGQLLTNQSAAGFDAAFASVSSYTEVALVRTFAIPTAENVCFEHTGFLRVPRSGRYDFGVTSDDGSDLSIRAPGDAQWTSVASAYGFKAQEAAPPNPGTISLVAGVPYALRVRHNQGGGGIGLAVLWRPPGGAVESAASWHPPTMTAHSTTVNGLVYVVSASSERTSGGTPNLSAWRAFDGSETGNSYEEWQSGDTTYNDSTGVSIRDLPMDDGAVLGYAGEFLQVRLPFSVVPASYEVAGDMASFRLYASRTDTPGEWTLLDERTGIALAYTTIRTFNVTAGVDQAFHKFALKINSSHRVSGHGRASIMRFRVSGRQPTFVSLPLDTTLLTAQPTAAGIPPGGLLLWLDPAVGACYPGSGSTLTDLAPGQRPCALSGTHAFVSAGSIRLDNSGASRNASLQLPDVAGVRTLFLWYRVHSTAPSGSSVLVDARPGVADGFVSSAGSVGPFTTAFVNGGQAALTTWSTVAAVGHWRSVALVATSAFTDNLTLFSDGVAASGMDVTFGPVLVYTRVLTRAEIVNCHNAYCSRFGVAVAASDSPLDALTPSERNACNAVFATRLLVPSYAGSPVVRLRRPSDGALADFAGDLSGNLTVVQTGQSLDGWRGTDTGYPRVVTWYDQTGKGHHASQATLSRQPALIGGRVVFLPSSGTFLDVSYDPDLNTSTFTYMVTCTNYGGGTETHESPLTSRADLPQRGYLAYRIAQDRLAGQWVGTGSTWASSSSTAVQLADRMPHRFASRYDGTRLTSWVNGAAVYLTTSFSPNTSAPFRIGAGATESATGQFYWNGDISDVIFFGTPLPDASVGSLSRSMGGTLRADACVLDALSAAGRSTCVAAYGMQQLSSAHGGFVVRLRRASDNQTADFRADARGSLFTASGQSLAEWASASASVHVDTWYDQTGRGRHMSQANSTRQPTVILSDANAIAFASTNFLSGGNVFDTATVTDMHLVASVRERSRQINTLISLNGNVDDSFKIHAAWSDGRWYWDAGNLIGNRSSSDATATAVDQRVTFSGWKSSADGRSGFRLNGGVNGTYTSSGNAAASASGGIRLGEFNSVTPNHHVFSVLVFSVRLSDRDDAVLAART